jgi:hypothetical protein
VRQSLTHAETQVGLSLASNNASDLQAWLEKYVWFMVDSLSSSSLSAAPSQDRPDLSLVQRLEEVCSLLIGSASLSVSTVSGASTSSSSSSSDSSSHVWSISAVNRLLGERGRLQLARRILNIMQRGHSLARAMVPPFQELLQQQERWHQDAAAQSIAVQSVNLSLD